MWSIKAACQINLPFLTHNMQEYILSALKCNFGGYYYDYISLQTDRKQVKLYVYMDNFSARKQLTQHGLTILDALQFKYPAIKRILSHPDYAPTLKSLPQHVAMMDILSVLQISVADNNPNYGIAEYLQKYERVFKEFVKQLDKRTKDRIKRLFNNAIKDFYLFVSDWFYRDLLMLVECSLLKPFINENLPIPNLVVPYLYYMLDNKYIYIRKEPYNIAIPRFGINTLLSALLLLMRNKFFSPLFDNSKMLLKYEGEEEWLSSFYTIVHI